MQATRPLDGTLVERVCRSQRLHARKPKGSLSQSILASCKQRAYRRRVTDNDLVTGEKIKSRNARIVCVISDLDGSVRSLPRPCKNAQASSNASQIVRVLLKLNASGFSTMTQTPHARHASVRERRTLCCDPVD